MPLKPELDVVRENEILKDKDYIGAYYYAKQVIGGRWPKAEEFIKTDPKFAYYYAKYIIKGRWPEAEEFIKKNAEYAYDYAIDIIKGRWPEAEETIMKSDIYWDMYCSRICKECHGAGILDLGIGGAEEECCKCNGCGFENIH